MNPPHVGARAWKAARGLHGRDQSLDEARSRNRPCSDNLDLINKLQVALGIGLERILTEVDRKYPLNRLVGSHFENMEFSIPS